MQRFTRKRGRNDAKRAGKGANLSPLLVVFSPPERIAHRRGAETDTDTGAQEDIKRGEKSRAAQRAGSVADCQRNDIKVRAR